MEIFTPKVILIGLILRLELLEILTFNIQGIEQSLLNAVLNMFY